MTDILPLLAGFLKGRADSAGAAYQREQQQQEAKLKSELIKLQTLKMKQDMQQQQMKQKLLDAILAGMGTQEIAAGTSPEQPKMGESMGGGQKKQGLSDLLSNAQMLTALKLGGDIDLTGLANFQRGMSHDQVMEQQGADRLKLQERGLDLRQNEPHFVERTMPGGAKELMAIPKFGYGGGMVTSPPPTELPISDNDLGNWVDTKTLNMPPPGTTPKQAQEQGFKRITAKQKESVQAFQGAAVLLNKTKSLMEQVFPPQESAAGRIFGGASRTIGAAAQTNAKAAELVAFIGGTLSPFIRSLGEKGAIADKDVDRALKLMPKLNDRADVAWSKIQNLFDLLRQTQESAIGTNRPSLNFSAPGKADYVYNPATGKLEPSR